MNILDKVTPFESIHVNIQDGPQPALPAQNKTAQTAESSRPVDRVTPSDRVDISTDGKIKGAKEGIEAQNRNAMQNLATKGKEATAAEENSEIDNIDKMIEELEAQVRELMQQLAKLKANDDEASIEQQKVLEAQIAALNSQIMSLSGMKLEMLEQGKK